MSFVCFLHCCTPVLALRMTITFCPTLGIGCIYLQLRSEIKMLFLFVVDFVVIIFNCFTLGSHSPFADIRKIGMDGKYIHSLHSIQNILQARNSLRAQSLLLVHKFPRNAGNHLFPNSQSCGLELLTS